MCCNPALGMRGTLLDVFRDLAGLRRGVLPVPTPLPLTGTQLGRTDHSLCIRYCSSQSAELKRRPVQEPRPVRAGVYLTRHDLQGS